MDGNPDYMDEVISEFVVETTELLEQLDRDLLNLEKRPNDLELINQIFRSVHTIKGTSGFLGFERMNHLAHVTEEVLNHMRKGRLQLKPEVMDLILEAVDCISRMLSAIKEAGNEGDVCELQLTERLKSVAAAVQAATPGDTSEKENKLRVGVEESQSESKADASTESPAGGELRESGSDPSNPDRSVGLLNQQNISHTVRVPVHRLDELMNLVGELVLGRNRLQQVCTLLELMIRELQKGRYESEASSLDRQTVANLDSYLEMLLDTNSLIGLLTTELQTTVLQTRMLPADTLFRRVPRYVRDLCREMGKDVEVVIEGADTELDKTVIEELADPLTHLIRNSLDHGIETPEERRKYGKPPQGRLRIWAYQQGNHIHIGIEDDGRGIDPEKVKSSAIRKGLITESEAQRMNDREAMNLIFQPGFSTKEQVTTVSGRGVGMDVVKTNVMRLNGMIEVRSEKGKGTTFLLKLPLTLAIIQGLIVRVAGEVLIVPIVSVLETIRITVKDFHRVADQRVIRLRDSVIPVIDLAEYFSLDRPLQEERDYYVVLVASANRKVGLLVDGLLGQEEVVIKSLGSFFERQKAIAGATIMGDGRVRLIIDVSDIAGQVQGNFV